MQIQDSSIETVPRSHSTNWTSFFFASHQQEKKKKKKKVNPISFIVIGETPLTTQAEQLYFVMLFSI